LIDQELFESCLADASKVLVIDSSYGLHPWRFALNISISARKRQKEVLLTSIWRHQVGLIYGNFLALLRRLKYQNERYSITAEIMEDFGIKSVYIPRMPIMKVVLLHLSKILHELRRVLRSPGEIRVGIDSYLSHKRPKLRFTRSVLTPLWYLRAIHLYLKGLSIALLLQNSTQPSLVFVFNSRFPLEAGIFSVFSSAEVTKVLQFDGGSLSEGNFNRVQFFQVSPHSHLEIGRKIDSYWSNGSPEKKALAIEQMTALVSGKRAFGSEFSWLSIDDHRRETLGVSERNYALFFGSSDWESAAFRFNNLNNGFSTQFDACSSLASCLDKRNIDLFVKPHPMRKNVSQLGAMLERQKWEKLRHQHRNLFLLPSNLTARETNNLMRSSILVAGYRTSMTAQSIFCQIPTLFLYKSAWVNKENDENLAVSVDEIEHWLNKFSLNQVRVGQDLKDSILPWAFYSRVAGYELDEVHFSGTQVTIGARLIDKPRGFSFTK
jgi:hypothetical protein